jgi:outer membrane protein assembly factor BamB
LVRPCHIASHDLLVFGADDGVLYGVTASTGAELWTWRHQLFGKFNMASSPVFDSVTQLLYFGTSDRTGHIFAVRLGAAGTDAAPKLEWALATGIGDGVPGGPALSGGALTVGANDGKVYHVNATTGAVLWTTQTHGIVYSSPAYAVRQPNALLVDCSYH